MKNMTTKMIIHRGGLLIMAIPVLFALLPSCSEVEAHNHRGTISASAFANLDSATTFSYYPSLHELEVNVGAVDPAVTAAGHQVEGSIRIQGTDKSVADWQFDITSKGGKSMIRLPSLTNGTYELRLQIKGSGSSLVRSFRHENFPWLGNNLGKSDLVYAPFEPVRVKGKDVQVVLRTYTMNGFGLWDQVKSEGRNILAAPVVLHLVTEKGELKWNFTNGKWISQAANAAVYQAEAVTAPVRLKSTSTIEYDGCMKVELDLLPGISAETIRHLWLEIPLKNEEAPLFHYSMAPEIRRNYSGAVPHGGKITWSSFPGDTDPPKYPRGAHEPVWKAEPGSENGVVWTNHDERPWEHVWKADFVPYIWLGGGTRGIAWFGASPRGYKLDPKGTMQQIERDGKILRLKVDLVNAAGPLTGERKIIFGLQASPTKPMPKDWRSNVAIPGIDIGVHCAPWGAHGCSDKYPDDADFRVADELIKVRQTGILDTAVFKKLDHDRSAHYCSMTNHQDTSWLAWVLQIAKSIQAFTLEADMSAQGFIQGALSSPYRYHVDGAKHEVNPLWNTVSHERLYPDRVADKIRNAPLVMYFEEHASTVVNTEWVVYQDEWRGKKVHKPRSEYVAEPPVALNNFTVGRQGFPPSYRDFAIWYANEWMKRGVGIYCDNVYQHLVDNPLTSEAFIDDDGDLQPATDIWDLREYHKRMWVLAQQWNLKHPPYPIVITHHMSNSLMLPVHTWNDAMLDLEYPFSRGKDIEPFSAEYLLAQATGHQTGSYRHLLNSVQRIPGGAWFRESVSQMDSNVVRTEWGMRMVHEALRWLFPHENFSAFEPARTLEKKLWQFGYGTEDCKVINYWGDNGAVKISDPQVKWLLLERKSDKTLLLVLQSYEKEGATVNLKLDGGELGFLPFPKAHEVETGAEAKVNSSGKELTMKVSLPGRFGTKVLIIGSGS